MAQWTIMVYEFIKDFVIWRIVYTLALNNLTIRLSDADPLTLINNIYKL